MKTLKIILILSLITYNCYCQTYRNAVLGKYAITDYRDCSGASTVIGVLYLEIDPYCGDCVGEGDSSSFGQLGEPWDIQVYADSSLVRSPGATYTDTAAAFGRLYPNDSIHLRVTVFGSPFCHRVFDGFKLYSTATGINELELKDEGITAYPNPANTEFYIQSMNSLNAEPHMFDLNGKEMLIERERLNAHCYKLNVSSLIEGIYLLRCATSTGFINRKIVVQH